MPPRNSMYAVFLGGNEVLVGRPATMNLVASGIKSWAVRLNDVATGGKDAADIRTLRSRPVLLFGFSVRSHLSL
jgi:hypothetical protein